jgi:hypothetical protein
MTKERHPEIEGFAFAPVPKVVALQGADMIATETYQYNLKWLKDRENAPANANAHFRDYLKRELSAGIVFDREQIARNGPARSRGLCPARLARTLFSFGYRLPIWRAIRGHSEWKHDHVLGAAAPGGA